MRRGPFQIVPLITGWAIAFTGLWITLDPAVAAIGFLTGWVTATISLILLERVSKKRAVTKYATETHHPSLTYPASPPTLPTAPAALTTPTAARLRTAVERIAVGPRTRMLTPGTYHTTEAWVADELARMGADVTEAGYSLKWTIQRRDAAPLWAFRLAPYRPYRVLAGANMHAVLPAKGTGKLLPPVILLAHLDTVSSTPGAVDNASGVAVALETARGITGAENSRETHVVIVDMEEIGFIGAKQWVTANREWLLETRAELVVLESVGYFDDTPGSQQIHPGVALFAPKQYAWMTGREAKGDFLMIGHRQDSQPLTSTLIQHANQHNLPVLPFNDPRGGIPCGSLIRWVAPPLRHFDRSDHIPAWNAGIPAIVVSGHSGMRGGPYHKPEDTPDVLDYERMAALTHALTEWLTTPSL